MVQWLEWPAPGGAHGCVQQIKLYQFDMEMSQLYPLFGTIGVLVPGVAMTLAADFVGHSAATTSSIGAHMRALIE
jgi:hypothetical protein